MGYNEKFIRENPEKVRATHKLANRKRNKRLKEQGLCVICGKRPAVEGKCRCKMCLEKKRKAYYLQSDLIPRCERVANGLCYTCGEPVEEYGKKLCEKCSEIMTRNISNAE
jgi:hypothetical protein